LGTADKWVVVSYQKANTAPGYVNIPGGFGFRNRIINGDMRIDQRNAGASLTVSSNNLVYSLDRWVFQPLSTSMSVQRIGSGSGPFSIQINGNAGSTGFNLIQKIESYNVSDLASQTVTLTFTVSSTVLTTATAYYQTPTAQDNFGSLNSIVSIGAYPITTTPTRQSLTFTLPASAVNGLQLFVINGGALTSGSVNIKDVQLEAGSVATTFERRDYGRELMMCQRYYETGKYSTIQQSTNGFGVGSTQSFVVAKRTVPTMVYTLVSSSGVNTTANDWNTTVTNFGVYHFANATGNVQFVNNYTAVSEL
jgi:hypothetical protein